MREGAPQRDYPMRELLNALRYVIRYGIAWRAMPNDFPPWSAVYQQAQRWLAAGCFEALAQDLRAVLRLASGRSEEPTAAIIDSRTLRSTPESGTRAGYDGAKRKRGSKVHLAVDTLGHLLALHVTPADVGDREAVARLAADIQEATGDNVHLAFVDQGYTGQAAADAAASEGITLHVVKLPEAKRGFVLLPRRWVVERSFAWATRCRRLVKDYERYAQTLAGFHVIAFVGYMLKHAAELITGA
jgi:transposase